MSNLSVPIHTYKRRFESDFNGNTVDDWDDPPASLFGGNARAGKGFGPMDNIPFNNKEYYPLPPQNDTPPNYRERPGFAGALLFPCVANYYEGAGVLMDSAVDEVEIANFGSPVTARYEFRFFFDSLSVAVLLGYRRGIGASGFWRERGSRGAGYDGSRRIHVLVREAYTTVYIDYLTYADPTVQEWFGGIKIRSSDLFAGAGTFVREELFYIDLPEPCRATTGSVAVSELSRFYLATPSGFAGVGDGVFDPSGLFVAGQRTPAVSDFNQITSATPRLTVTAVF